MQDTRSAMPAFFTLFLLILLGLLLHRVLTKGFSSTSGVAAEEVSGTRVASKVGLAVAALAAIVVEGSAEAGEEVSAVGLAVVRLAVGSSENTTAVRMGWTQSAEDMTR